MWFNGSRRPEMVRDEPRVAVAATVETPLGVVTVANTHLTFVEWWNGRQLGRIRGALARTPHPLVLMGDLNMGQARAEQGGRALVAAMRGFEERQMDGRRADRRARPNRGPQARCPTPG